MRKEDFIPVVNEKEILGFFGNYSWLSNFHEADVYFDGLHYTSSEAAYQSAKTKDIKERKRFTKMTPIESKKEGKKLKLREDWESVKYDIMASIVFDKFYRHEYLRVLLLQTGDKYIEESNYWKDVVWGVCDGVGTNWLGEILMKIREFWKKEDKGFQL